jgi:hypothetical protein
VVTVVTDNIPAHASLNDSVRFEAHLHPETACKARFIKFKCRLPNYTEMFHNAVVLFDFCLSEYSNPDEPRKVFFLNSVTAEERELWPYPLQAQASDVDTNTLTRFSCNMNITVSHAVQRIKEVYNIDSNDSCIQLLIDHYFDIVRAHIEMNTLVTSSLAGTSRKELVMLYSPSRMEQP